MPQRSYPVWALPAIGGGALVLFALLFLGLSHQLGKRPGREANPFATKARPAPRRIDPPAPEPEGLPFDVRRAIYAETYRVGMLATYEAEWRCPVGGDGLLGPDGPAILKAHQEIYKEVHDRAMMGVAARFGIDVEKIDPIREEGVRSRWPLPDVPNPFAGVPSP